MDPPDHGRRRGLVQRVFTPKAFEARTAAIGAFVDELDVARERPAPLIFGGGIHHCLGAAMGRIEGRLAAEGLVRRTTRLRLDGEHVWRAGAVFRGLEKLPVTVH